jgi:hypothetical protein
MTTRGAILQDIIQRGLGHAARVIGGSCDAYRPNGAHEPLSRANRYLRLTAAFAPPSGGFARPGGYGEVTWQGIFDAGATRVGDYLVDESAASGRAVWFIAAQQPLLPVLCVRADRRVTFARPAAATMRAWPVSVTAAAGHGGERVGLPGDGSGATWHVLLPAFGGVTLRNGDLMTDDLGRAGVVGSAELSDLGWRLVVRQAAT